MLVVHELLNFHLNKDASTVVVQFAQSKHNEHLLGIQCDTSWNSLGDCDQ